MTPKKPTPKKKKKKKKTIDPELRKQVLENQPDVTRDLPEQDSLVRSDKQRQVALKRKVRYAYDLQRLRLQAGGRGQEKGKKPKSEEKVEIELHPVDQMILDIRANELERAETLAFKDVERHLETMPVYHEFKRRKELGEFRGVNVRMIAVIFSENDIHRQKYPSQMHSFAGLAPVDVRRCSQCNQVVEETKNGTWKHSKGRVKSIKCDDGFPRQQTYASGRAVKPTAGEKLPYNAFLKMKMVGVMASCLVMQNEEYKKIYDDYRRRWESAGKGVNDKHKDQAAKRYMVKLFLTEIWKMWRGVEGLPIPKTYQEEKLGHVHSG